MTLRLGRLSPKGTFDITRGRYLDPGRRIYSAGGIVGLLLSLADDAGTMQRALANNVGFGSQLKREFREQNPEYLITPFGVMPNPFHQPRTMS